MLADYKLINFKSCKIEIGVIEPNSSIRNNGNSWGYVPGPRESPSIFEFFLLKFLNKHTSNTFEGYRNTNKTYSYHICIYCVVK